jgi:hypothetical protein
LADAAELRDVLTSLLGDAPNSDDSKDKQIAKLKSDHAFWTAEAQKKEAALQAEVDRLSGKASAAEQEATKTATKGK